MRARTGAGRYARVLSTPHARALLLAEFPARLPIALNGLALVLFVRQHRDSYAAAGAVAAVFGAAVGLTGPLLGRLIDRHGVRQVVVPAAVAHGAAMGALVACGLAGAPLGALLALAVAAGGFLPPIGSISRSLWPRILREGGEAPELLSTALAIEGVLIELVFVTGPLLVAAIAALVDPGAALVLSPVLLLVGLVLFLVQPPVQTWVISAQASRSGALGALRSPGVRTLVLTTLPMGFCFGAMEVMLPAFCEEHGSRNLAGALLAAWAGGSAIGGLLYGARAWTGPAGERYARLALLLPLGYLPLAVAPSIAAMAPLVLLAGLCIAPTLTAGNQIAGAVAPDGAETEAYTWPITALVIGLAVGNVTTGAVVSASGWQAGALAAAGGAVAAAVLATLGRHTLEPRPLGLASG